MDWHCRLVFSKRKRRFSKRFLFLNFYLFVLYSVVPLMRRWGAGEGVLEKIEKNLLSCCLSSNTFPTLSATSAMRANLWKVSGRLQQCHSSPAPRYEIDLIWFVPSNILKYMKDKKFNSENVFLWSKMNDDNWYHISYFISLLTRIINIKQ